MQLIPGPTFVAQWFLAVLLPAFCYLGRGLVGAELGWMAVIGIAVFGVPTILVLVAPPVVCLFDTAARQARAVRRGYAWATWTLWVALLVAGLTMPDSSDTGHLLSAVSAWTGLSYEASTAIFYTVFGVAVLAWLAALAAAIAGVVTSRRTAVAAP